MARKIRRKRRRFGRLRHLPSGRWQAQYVGPDPEGVGDATYLVRAASLGQHHDLKVLGR